MTNFDIDTGQPARLGLTHFLFDGQLIPLLKCPACNFRNIYEDVITYHIQCRNDAKHDVDINQLDKRRYIVTRALRESQYGPYVRSENLPLP